LRPLVRFHAFALFALGSLVACGDSNDAVSESTGATEPTGRANPAGEPDGGTAEDDDAGTNESATANDAGEKTDGEVKGADAGPICKKHLTVVFAVGTGAGATRSHSNGCWDVVDADGAANASFRKCSTSNFVVQNPSAKNWAYDDTNPTRPLSQDTSFLHSCSNGATGDGYEYMAYRGGWRILGATNLRAYFAELYGDSADDIDSLYAQAGVYTNNAQLKAHAGHVFPMMNAGPPASANLQGKIGTEAAKLCKTVADGGYFGVYVADYASPMPKADPRVLALANALNNCTK
jgi:hypothetical protein